MSTSPTPPMKTSPAPRQRVAGLVTLVEGERTLEVLRRHDDIEPARVQVPFDGVPPPLVGDVDELAQRLGLARALELGAEQVE